MTTSRLLADDDRFRIVEWAGATHRIENRGDVRVVFTEVEVKGHARA